VVNQEKSEKTYITGTTQEIIYLTENRPHRPAGARLSVKMARGAGRPGDGHELSNQKVKASLHLGSKATQISPFVRSLAGPGNIWTQQSLRYRQTQAVYKNLTDPTAAVKNKDEKLL
jgi:hypothetical protein